MFDRSLRLGNIFGFTLQAHWSLLIIFLLIALQLGFGVLPAWHPEWSAPLIGLVAITASVVFFASIAVHELAHAIAARGFGLEVSSITLFLFGGVSNLETEPNSPGSEALIAVAGPLTSIVLGVVMLVMANFMMPNMEALATEPEAVLSSVGPIPTILLWAGPLNILLAVFNLLPAFPMDGGRILRSVMWRVSGDLPSATRSAAMVSRVFSWMLIGLGFAMAIGVPIPYLGGGLIGGLWIALIGWFIGNAAKATVVSQRIGYALEGVHVGDIATADVAVVDVSTSIQEVVDRYLHGAAPDRLLVGDGQRIVGVIRIDDVKAVPRESWPAEPIRRVMRPLTQVDTLNQHTDALTALREFERRGTPEIPVSDEEGRISGVLRLDDLMRWIRIYGGAPA